MAQNQLQKNLLTETFGKNTRCTVVGMNTGELDSKNLSLSHSFPETLSYDVVYHGAAHSAKGINFIIELASLMPSHTFFIPCSKESCEAAINQSINLSNTTFKSCTWETGLKDTIQGALITINPSIWSAPIEGALLKSIAFSYTVATVNNEFGYHNEVSEHYKLIELPTSAKDAASQLGQKIQQLKQKKENTDTQEFFEHYNKQNLDVLSIFRRNNDRD